MKKLVILFLLILAFSSLSYADIGLNRERTFDALNYSMRIRPDRKNKKIFGDVSILLKPLDNNFRILELDARDIDFTKIELKATKQPLNFESNKRMVTINLDRAYSKDEKIEIRLVYSVKPKKGIYFVDQRKRRGKILQYSQVWTQGQAEETHYWLPSFDFPDDKATTEQFITAEKGETVIGNGKLINIIENPDGTKVFHFKMNQPHSIYLTSFVIGRYIKISDQHGDIPLGFYVYPGQESLAKKAFGNTKSMMTLFENITNVKYPFDKYDQTIVSEFKSGGMENITATTLADTEVFLARSRLGVGLVEDLVAHELAHSWFGNLVTCRNWAELWLNEGFATYFEALYRGSKAGRIAYLQKIQEDAQNYLAYTANFRGNEHALFNPEADASDDDSMFDPITYSKGSAVVHMLHQEVGSEAFWKGIKSYLETYKFKNVETKDLKIALENASGKDLGWFFTQWVENPGYSELRVEQTYMAKTKTLVIDFKQKRWFRRFSSYTFRIPIEVLIEIGGKKYLEKFVIDSREFTKEIKVEGKPMRITYDPNYKLPLVIISTNSLKVVR